MLKRPRRSLASTTLFVLAMASMTLGCADERHPILGTWIQKQSELQRSQEPSERTIQSEATLTFQQNGRFIYKFPRLHPGYQVFVDSLLDDQVWGPDGHRNITRDGTMMLEGRYKIIDEDTVEICGPADSTFGIPGMDCGLFVTVFWELLFSDSQLRIQQKRTEGSIPRLFGWRFDENGSLRAFVESFWFDLLVSWTWKAAIIPNVSGAVFERSE